jgi:fatty acid amide hydrolase 2
VPNSGQFPLAVGENARNCATGPITRRAEDLPTIMKILAGPDGICEGAAAMKLGDVRDVDVRKLSVLSVPDDGGRIFVSPALREAQARVEAWFESRGARVRRKRLKNTKHSVEIWSAALSTSNGATYAELLGNGEAIEILKEAGKFARGRSPFTLPSIALAAIERFTKNDKQNASFLELGRALKEELANEIGEDGIFLYPSHAMPAPKHGFPMLLPVMWAYTAVWNAVRVPTTQVPLGLDARGVPLGIQVGAMHGQDHRTMAVAIALEDAFGGWVRPRL